MRADRDLGAAFIIGAVAVSFGAAIFLAASEVLR